MFPFNKKKPLLTADEQQQVVACIREAEANTTGELRVFVESRCSYMDAIDRAWELFHKLAMDATERRNAVLVYLAIDDHQYAIVGDKDIYEKAGGAMFWESAAAKLRQHLKKGETGIGLANCVKELGTAMATHFPYDPSITKNELPDEIVFGK
jgi:uncharacterized membrane protein